MKEFNGYADAKKQAQASGGAGRLPAGAYVCQILGVKYEAGKDGNSDMIRLQFDVAEGEHKGFFKAQYDANTNEDKKYKGNATVYVPKDDGSEKDGWTKKSFAGWTNAFEESNQGYSWDWDEKKWKGLLIGVIYGEVGTVIDGKSIKYNECRFPASASQIREGNFKIPDIKKKKGYSDANPISSDGFVNVPKVTKEEIPF